MHRITDFTLIPVRVSDKTVWQHLVLHSSEGLTGTGEYTVPVNVVGIEKQLITVAGTLIGQVVSRDALESHLELLTQGLACATIYSVLEQALCDLEAQSQGISIATLLGDVRPAATVDLYANINRCTRNRTPAGFVESARHAIASGFNTLKMAPFDGLTPALCSQTDGLLLIDAGLQRISAVAATLAEHSTQLPTLQVDCHWRLSYQGALAMLDSLAETGVSWLECPLPENLENLDALSTLRTQCHERGIRLAGLETAAAVYGFRPYIDAGAYDVIMPDIKHAGGYESILEIARHASRHGITLSLHNPSGPIAHVASLQLASILPHRQQHEFQFDESPMFWTSTEPAPPRMAHGQSEVPDRSGLGTRLSKSVVTGEKA